MTALRLLLAARWTRSVGVSAVGLVMLAGCAAQAGDDARQVTEPTVSSTIPEALAESGRAVGETSSAPADAADPDGSDRTAGAASSETKPSEVDPETETALNGRMVPAAPTTPAEAAEAFVEVERALRIVGESDHEYPDVGHREQLVVRTLSRNPEWVPEVRAALPDDLRPTLDLHLRARAELGSLHTAPPLETLPAWRIIQPEPLDRLVEYYMEAEADTGIDWQILAAINLIETGMGRIDGLSSAGAQGPMQFLPTTWEEVGEGSIDDPQDAIAAAARYLVQRGGLEDIRAGLFGYNNSDNYVNAVLTYAELITLDEAALRGLYNWEIYVGTDVGTLWLPVGFTTDGTRSAADYKIENPWAETIAPTS